jgi:hypothetical protein
VQSLLWVSLVDRAQTGKIAERTAQFRPTRDGKTLLVLKTNGDLQTWDLAGRSGVPKTLVSGVAVFTQGASGQVAWLGVDHSLHVVGLDGTKLLDLDAATAKADLFASPLLVSDAVYYWQLVEPQNSRGQLWYVKLAGGSAPVKVGDNVSLADVALAAGTLLYERNVDAVGNFGEATSAAPDGSAATTLGTRVPVGGLVIGIRNPGGWYGLFLSNTVISAETPSDGSLPITGALAFAGSGGGQVELDGSVHAFALSNSGFTATYSGGAAWNAVAGNFVGSLMFVDTAAPGTRVDGKLAGVAELGPILNRRFFVSAPAAAKPGIYYVSY